LSYDIVKKWNLRKFLGICFRIRAALSGKVWILYETVAVPCNREVLVPICKRIRDFHKMRKLKGASNK